MRVRRALTALLGRQLYCPCGRPSAHLSRCLARRDLARADEIAAALLIPLDAAERPQRLVALEHHRTTRAFVSSMDNIEQVDARLTLRRLVMSLAPKERVRLLTWIARDGSVATVSDLVVKLRAVAGA